MIKELRIGNLVFDKNGNIKSVCSILNNTLMLEDNQYIGTPIEWCNPIPLTEEWLLKFGFKEVEGFFVKGHLRLLAIRDLYWRANYPIIVDIIHVHQLQNLYFSLCGEELTFKP